MTGVLAQLVTVFAAVVIAYVGQNLLNQFAENNSNWSSRKSINYETEEQAKKRRKDPNKAPLPPPPNKKKKNNTGVEKKVNHDPVADNTGNNNPVPNNDDAPNITFKRIIPPNNTPTNNQKPTPTPEPFPINVKKPPLFEHTGKFIYQPLEDYELPLFSMPCDGSVPNWTPLSTEQQNANKMTEYIDFLKDSKVGNPLGKHKISDLIPVFLPPAGNADANPALIAGSEALGKVIEAFENYSEGFISEPLYFIPNAVKINIIQGNTARKRRYGTDIDTNFKPVNENTPEFILDQSLFTVPKEVTMEQLLEFAGYAATFEGGAEKWEQYKANPAILKDPTFFDDWNIPTSNDVLNEGETPTTTTKTPVQYQKQNLKINSVTELLIVAAGVLYTKTGLHEFPSELLPGLKNNQPIPEGETDQNKKNKTNIRVGSLAAGMAYMANWFNFKVGDFPAEIEVPDTESTDPKATKKEKVDISGALTNLLTMGGIGLALNNFNKDINLRNAGEIEAAKNAAVKAGECSCINMANNGFNTRPKAQCNQGAMNFTSAKGFGEMLKNTQRCHQGSENADPATLKAMLENIMFGVNIIKSSFFRGEKELDNQEKVLKNLLKGKINDDDLDKFIQDFNTQKTPITKEYPIKAKIVKKDKGGTP